MIAKLEMLSMAVLLPLVISGCGGENSTGETVDRAEIQPVAAAQADASSSETGTKEMNTEKIEKTDEQWRAQLTPEQYHILREQGTERAFTGKYWDEKAEGTYVCAACDQPLYSSETKFKSGTGWPSFWAPLDEDAVATKPDRSWFTTRTEVVCSRCDGHLGHVFDDGPQPTGKRHCLNSAALKLVKADEVKADEQ